MKSLSLQRRGKQLPRKRVRQRQSLYRWKWKLKLVSEVCQCLVMGRVNWCWVRVSSVSGVLCGGQVSGVGVKMCGVVLGKW